MMDMEMDDEYGEHAVKCAAETLVKAEEIKKNLKLLGLVKAELEKSAGAIKSIKELRKVASVKMSESKEDEEDNEDEVPPELMTEEDKAAKQSIMKQDKRTKELGLKKSS